MTKRLSKRSVLKIRKEVAAGANSVELAARYGVTKRCINYISAGRSHPEVGGPITKGLAGRVGRLAKNSEGGAIARKLKNKRDRKIFQFRKSGHTFRQVAARFGITPSWAQRIVRKMECQDVEKQNGSSATPM